MACIQVYIPLGDYISTQKSTEDFLYKLLNGK